MKYITMTAIVAMMAMPTQAGIWDTIATSGWETVEPLSAYKVEAYGQNFRVYEWVSPENPNIVCMTAVGNTDASPYMGLQCFPRGEKDAR